MSEALAESVAAVEAESGGLLSISIVRSADFGGLFASAVAGDPPAALDRRADAELSLGRHSVAEQLAHRAHELRMTNRDREFGAAPR
jgi:hypothetical protein